MKRILLIEDDRIYAELATILLQRNGYTVIRARTAAEGLALAREGAPDLILMDVNLPDMKGFEAMHKLRQDPGTQHVPAIAFTAAPVSSEPEERAARAAGFDAYVTKPITESEFRAMIEALGRGSSG